MTDAALTEIRDLVVRGRAQLQDELLQTLRRTLFLHRSFVRPASLVGIAADEVKLFLDYLAQSDPAVVIERGRTLAQAGVSIEAVAEFGPALRRACAGLISAEQHQSLAPLIDPYSGLLAQGYVKAAQQQVLAEQEHIRLALHRSLSQFSLQIQAASQVARATTSILDLPRLLSTAVDLIRQRFELAAVAAFLLDDSRRVVELRAVAAAPGYVTMPIGKRTRLDAHPGFTHCVSSRGLFTSTGASVLLPSEGGIATEMLLPLIARDQVLGLLLVASEQPAAFTSHDTTAFQLLADQLATAIENAHLYASVIRRADELAEANERLKELDQLKTHFIQNVSHELRTPLATIHGYLELLRGNLLGELEPRQKDALNVIADSSNTLTNLVSGIMTIVEVEARSGGVEAVAPIAVTKLVLESFQPLAAEAGVSLNFELPPEDGFPVVLARSSHVQRVLGNVLSNAVKFTDLGGSIHMRLWTTGREVCWTITDNGIGIPPEHQHRVFERFYQVEGSLRRRFEGAGLGLAVAREIVELHGGHIEVQSEGVGKGSTFLIGLPALKPGERIAGLSLP